MMLYALIFVMAGYQGGADIETLYKYPDEDSCKAAATELLDNGESRGVTASSWGVTCVPVPENDDAHHP